ncbi:MAG: L-threonylcarbamoyladenylate synthase [Acidobacteriota bacterium]
MRRISIDALNSSPEEVFRLRELLGNGGVAAVPTETFYALAADPFSVAGIQRVFQVKVRDDGKPLPVLFSSREQLERLGVVTDARTLDHYFRIWPAPLTVVFPIRAPIAASRGASTLAVRLPASRRLRVLLASAGALTGTSVNRSGSPPLDDPDAIESVFRREIGVLVDGGRTTGGKPSTIIDATKDPPELVRAGAFPWPSA